MGRLFLARDIEMARAALRGGHPEGKSDRKTLQGTRWALQVSIVPSDTNSGMAKVRLADLNGPKMDLFRPKWTKMDHFGPFLSGVIRANRFARFARIGWFARIGTSSDACESAWRAIKIGVSTANDSRESRCESPVPLRSILVSRMLKSSSE